MQFIFNRKYIMSFSCLPCIIEYELAPLFTAIVSSSDHDVVYAIFYWRISNALQHEQNNDILFNLIS